MHMPSFFRNIFFLVLVSLISIPGYSVDQKCGLLLTSASDIPQSGLKNRWVDYKTGTSTFGKVQIWSLGHILSILTRRIFTERAGRGEFGQLIGFITGKDIYPLAVNAHGDKAYRLEELQEALSKRKEAAELILAQYPELKDIQPPQFNSSDEVLSWLALQTEKYGENLLLVSLSTSDSTGHRIQ